MGKFPADRALLLPSPAQHRTDALIFSLQRTKLPPGFFILNRRGHPQLQTCLWRGKINGRAPGQTRMCRAYLRRRNCLEKAIPIPPRCCHGWGWRHQRLPAVGNGTERELGWQGTINQLSPRASSASQTWTDVGGGNLGRFQHRVPVFAPQEGKASSVPPACGHNIVRTPPPA